MHLGLYFRPPIVSSNGCQYVLFSYLAFWSIYTPVAIVGLKYSVSGETGPEILGMNVGICPLYSIIPAETPLKSSIDHAIWFYEYETTFLRCLSLNRLPIQRWLRLRWLVIIRGLCGLMFSFFCQYWYNRFIDGMPSNCIWSRSRPWQGQSCLPFFLTAWRAAFDLFKFSSLLATANLLPSPHKKALFAPKLRLQRNAHQNNEHQQSFN